MQTCKDAHVILSSSIGDQQAYEIVLGGSGNTVSGIRTTRQHVRGTLLVTQCLHVFWEVVEDICARRSDREQCNHVPCKLLQKLKSAKIHSLNCMFLCPWVLSVLQIPPGDD